MNLTNKETMLLYSALEFMLESVTDDFTNEEMMQVYKEDQELLDKIYKNLPSILSYNYNSCRRL